MTIVVDFLWTMSIDRGNFVLKIIREQKEYITMIRSPYLVFVFLVSYPIVIFLTQNPKPMIYRLREVYLTPLD